MQPSMEACAWIHQAQDRSWRPYGMRTPDAAMRTSPSHVYYLGRSSRDGDFNRRRGGFPEMATSIAGGASTARQCYPRCPEHQVFQDRPLPCPKHVGAIATIFVAAQPTRTSPRQDYGRLLLLPLQDLLQAGRKCRHRRGLGRSSKDRDLNRRSCPDYPARRGD
jgi:hypothetical protein